MNPIQFSNEDYLRFDDCAKKKVIEFVNKSKTLIAQENPNRYGIDLQLYKNGIFVGGIEVEVKKSLTDPNNNINWKTIHIAARKLKFFKTEGINLFVMLNESLTKMILIHGEKLLNMPLVNKITTRGMDTFIEVPLEEFKVYSL